jgi:hypothetical protein
VTRLLPTTPHRTHVAAQRSRSCYSVRPAYSAEHRCQNAEPNAFLRIRCRKVSVGFILLGGCWSVKSRRWKAGVQTRPVACRLGTQLLRKFDRPFPRLICRPRPTPGVIGRVHASLVSFPCALAQDNPLWSKTGIGVDVQYLLAVQRNPVCARRNRKSLNVLRLACSSRRGCSYSRLARRKCWLDK